MTRRDQRRLKRLSHKLGKAIAETQPPVIAVLTLETVLDACPTDIREGLQEMLTIAELEVEEHVAKVWRIASEFATMIRVANGADKEWRIEHLDSR